MKLAILLTVYNRKVKTLACLDNISRQNKNDSYSIDIYMTDDKSTDGTVESVKEKYPYVNIIKGTGNLYWNRGMIAAWQKAVSNDKYDYYLWLNDDTLLYNDAINMLIECSKIKEDNSIIVGSTFSLDGKAVTYGGYKENGIRVVPNGKLQLCEYFNGNIVLIPQKVYHIVGMNDARFSHSIGDFDYGLRAKKNGINSFVAPKVIGLCDRHNRIPIWCNKEYSMIKRLKAFASPLGAAPLEYFEFDKRYKGLVNACFGLIGSFIKCLFPKLFNKRMKKDKMYFNV